MKIFFDNTQIDGNYFSKITKSSTVYDGVFKLGTTICENYKTNVDKSISTPNIVEFKDDNNNLLKTLYLRDYNDNDSYVNELDLEDAMTKFNFRYDASPIMIHTKTVGEKIINYAYLSEILSDICTKAGVTNGIATFYQEDMEVSWYDNTLMARDYIGFIGEINGKNLCINSSNQLVFKDVKITPSTTISFNNLGNYKLGVEHTITRVVFDDGINKWEYGTNTGETYYINANNVYVINEGIVQHIYNEINGLTFYNFKVEDYPIENLQSGDLVAFSDGTNSYNTFIQFDNANFSRNSWYGKLELNVDSEAKQETQIIGEEEKLRRIKRIVDYDNLQVETLVEDVDSLNRIVQNDMYTKNEIQRIVDGTGVDGVKVTKVETISGTFDIDGMHYEKSDAYTKSTINEAGVEVDNSETDEELLFAGYDSNERKTVVRTEKLTTRKYLRIGVNSRLQDYKNGGGVFIE